MINKIVFIGLLMTLLGGFSLMIFTQLADNHTIVKSDFDTTVRIQNKVPRRMDMTLSLFSMVGSFEVLTSILVLWLAGRKKIDGIFIFGLYMIGMVLEVIGKNLISHPGPPFMFYRSYVGFVFPSSFVHTSFSYPSGHAYRSTFLILIILFTVLFELRRKSYHLLMVGCLIAFWVIMMISRVSLGEHWPSDVIGGVLLGITLTGLAMVLTGGWKWVWGLIDR